MALPLAAAGLLIGAPATISAAAGSASAAAPAAAPAAATAPKVSSASLPLHRAATVNLSAAPKAAPAISGGVPGEHYVVTDPDRNSVFTAGGGQTGHLAVSNPQTVTAGGTKGTVGFVGITGPSQAAVNGNGDLEPPDQGLCSNGSTTLEFVNNALQAYTTAGQSLAGPIASNVVFGQPASDFFSDPRCYFDTPTKRWFLTEFTVGTTTSSGAEATPSVQYIAVSDTANPLGSYHVYTIDTTDPTTGGCPCLGDYDQIGSDANGFYISTNEFGISSGAFNGSDIFALPLAALESAGGLGATPPSVTLYRLIGDAFGSGSSGPYHVAPASTPPGGTYAPNTEYFVESNSNATSDNHLIVYALNDTALLGSGTPNLTSTEVTSEAYAFPPTANQKAGRIPLGHKVGNPEGVLQADFNAIQEVTYTGGHLYAELDTATANNKDGIGWFILTPTVSSGGLLSASVAEQGYVTVAGENLLYPDVVVNSAGYGFLVFSMAGNASFPSAMDMPFGPTGPTGTVHTVAAGAAPEDGFTCYAALVGPNYGGCRWGDYSAGVAAGSRIYMATEYIPPTSRDLYSNWGTYVWSAPAGTPAS